MKRAKILNLFVAGLLLVTATAGCKKTPKNITTIPGQSQRDLSANDPGRMLPPPGLGQDRPIFSQQDPSQIAAPIEGGVENRVALAPQTIYFDFDRFSIKQSEQGKLGEVATYLKNNPNVQLKVEGHCDERGTEEYNRSLGERRAIAAREFLIQRHGIESGRITTASFGEDRPAEQGKDEQAYARNRRDEFVILSAQ